MATTRSQVLKDKPLKIRKSQVVLPKGGIFISSSPLKVKLQSKKLKWQNALQASKLLPSCIIVCDGITNNLRGGRAPLISYGKA
jgi:hypothetical protein